LLEQDLLAKNDALAGRNRSWLAAEGVIALNLIGSPGAGKTTLLEHTLRRLASELSVAVVEGDQATARDADRIAALGVPVVQINTGAGCHLDAAMVERALGVLSLVRRAVVFVENVGNLVCPAMFDLGERAKVVVMSVAEGDDKPLKYPHVFRSAQVLVLTKTDLLPHVDFDVEAFLIRARRINPGIGVFMTSAKRGDGLDDWCGFIRNEVERAQ
jgi:hydrogenase nickel incorporation protein HypB